MEAIAPGETGIISIIVPVIDTGEDPDLDGRAFLGIPDNYQVSNAVNCHTMELEGDKYIEIDDITESSSADITVALPD